MKVWLDYSTIKDWNGTLTGIPRTVFSIEKALSLLGYRYERVFINDELKSFYHLPADPKVEPHKIEKAQMSKGDILLSLGATWAYACYNDELSRLKCQGVQYAQLYYDLIPTKFPYFYQQGSGFGEYYGKILSETLDLCDLALFISDCSKKDICDFYKGSNNFLTKVIRLGEDFDLLTNAKVPKATNLVENNVDYIVCVGTLEKRKNQNMLLDAYRLMLSSNCRDKVPSLYLVGREGWMNGDISFQIENDPLLNGKVQIFNDVSDTELEELYDGSLFTVFPSLYEGWGLPISESFKRGKACLASNSSSMVEIAPELCILLNPHSPDEWATKILELSSDRSKLHALIERIKADYQPYSWKDTAKTIVKELKSIGYK